MNWGIIMETEHYIIIGIVLLALTVVLLILFLQKKKKKVKDVFVVDVEKIIELFGVNNVLNVERTQKRVRIEVQDLTKVDLETLKEYTNGIFTVGNKIVATFKEHTEEIIKTLGGKNG